MTVSNCIFTGNSAGYGGGIYNDGEFGRAALTVNNCTFRGNSAFSGGGILCLEHLLAGGPVLN